MECDEPLSRPGFLLLRTKASVAVNAVPTANPVRAATCRPMLAAFFAEMDGNATQRGSGGGGQIRLAMARRYYDKNPDPGSAKKRRKQAC